MHEKYILRFVQMATIIINSMTWDSHTKIHGNNSIKQIRLYSNIQSENEQVKKMKFFQANFCLGLAPQLY